MAPFQPHAELRGDRHGKDWVMSRRWRFEYQKTGFRFHWIEVFINIIQPNIQMQVGPDEQKEQR